MPPLPLKPCPKCFQRTLMRCAPPFSRSAARSRRLARGASRHLECLSSARRVESSLRCSFSPVRTPPPATSSSRRWMDYIPHFEGDADLIQDLGCDLVIAHPPCTYLSNAGLRWVHTNPERLANTAAAAAQFRRRLNAQAPFFGDAGFNSLSPSLLPHCPQAPWAIPIRQSVGALRGVALILPSPGGSCACASCVWCGVCMRGCL